MDEMLDAYAAAVRAKDVDAFVGLYPGSDAAAVSAFTSYAAVSPDGSELRSMNNRLTWILRRDAEGSWKIVHEHTSAPTGEGGKVRLRR
jgi:ketosteroid isomerase-like protein